MNIAIKILVLDDNKVSVGTRISDSFAPISLESSSNRGEWKVKLGDLIYEIKCDFIELLDEAKKVLFNKEELQQYHLILLDNNWEEGGGSDPDGKDGLRLLRDLFEAKISHPYLAIYTQDEGYSPAYIAEALNCGAQALIFKSEQTHFINVFVAAANIARLEQEKSRLTEEVSRLQEKEEGFVTALTDVEPRLKTKSQAMKDCLVDAARFAITPLLPVILVGPTGSGKEVLARAMHAVSPHRDKVFEILDCTTITTELAESFLFGHEKGAFTNAHSSRQGIFEIADGGTLFIDEVDALSLELQRKLLGVTEDKVYRRVGGSKVLHPNCRLIIATNKDLYKLVAKGAFLPDLFQRLNYGAIKIPSLNERREDIPDLAERFLEEFSVRHSRQRFVLTEEAKRVLQNHDWEFHVRELKATMFRSAVKCDGGVIGPNEIVFDLLSGKALQVTPLLSPSILANLVAAAPRQGSQRQILDLLLKKYPERVSYNELHEILGKAGVEGSAVGSLMTAVSRLNSLLGRFNLKAESDKTEKGYRIVELDMS